MSTKVLFLEWWQLWDGFSGIIDGTDPVEGADYRKKRQDGARGAQAKSTGWTSGYYRTPYDCIGFHEII